MDNKYKLFGLALAVFLIGDLEGTIRANFVIKRNQKMFDEQLNVKQMKINALSEALTDVVDGVDQEVVAAKFNEAKAFIDLIEKEI